MQGTYWLTVLPETSQLRPRIKRALRGVDDDVRVSPSVDDRKAESSGRRFGGKFRRGFDSSGAATPRVDDRNAESSGRSFGEKFRRGFERSGAARIGSTARLMGAGFAFASSQAGNVVRHVGVAATAIGLAARITKGFASSLLVASTGLKYVAGISLTKIGVALGVTAKLAGRLATQVSRVTSAVLVLASVGKLLGFMSRSAKLMSLLTIGGAALLGVVSALSYSLGVGLVAALTSIGSAVGVAAGALVGLLGPAIGVAKIGFKGLGEGAKAFAESMKDVWGPADEAFNQMIGQRMGPLLTQFRDLKMAVTDAFSGALIPAFGSLTGLMDGLQPRFTGLATTLGRVGSEVAGALASPATASALDTMFAASDRFVGKLGGGLSGLTSGLVQFASTAADTFADKWGAGINEQLLRAGEFLRNVKGEQMVQIFATLRQQIQNVWNVIKPIFEVIRQLGAVSAPALAPGFKAIGDAISQATPGLVRMAETLMPALAQVMARLAPVLPALVAAFTPWAGVLATIAPSIASVVANLAPLAPLLLVVVGAVKAVGVGMALYHTAMLVATNATRVLTAAQWLFNAAILANPIGLIVAAVVAAGVALWAFFTKTETGRQLWDRIWTGIKTTVSTVWNWLKSTLNTAWSQIGPSVMRIGEVARQAFGVFVGAVKTVWSAIQPAVAWIGQLWLAVQKVNFTIAIGALKALGAVIGWLWTNVAVPAFQGIATAIEVWWAGAQVIWDAATTAVGWVGDKLMWLWNTIAVPAFAGIGAAISTFWDGAKVIWDLLTAAFDRVGQGVGVLKDAFVTGFNAVKDIVTGVWNTISGIFDRIGNAIGGIADKLRGVPGLGSLIPGAAAGRPAGFASGRPASVSRTGAVSGAGTGTSDSILAMISNGEGIVKTAAMRAGGATIVAALNSGWVPSADYLHAMLPGFAAGRGPDVSVAESLAGTGYSQASRFDCSGTVARVINGALGVDGGLMSTKNARSWLAARGFVDGSGGPGTIRVGWYDHGPNPNDGHMAMTLSDGRNAESGGSSGAFTIGAGAAGAGDSQFDQHMYLPQMYGEGAGSSGSLGSATSAGGGGSYRAATDRELTVSAGRVSSANESVRQAGQSVDDRTYARDKAQRRVDQLKAEGKDTTDAQHSLDVANRELADANGRLADKRDKAAKAEQDDADLRSNGVLDPSAAKDKSSSTGGGFGDLGKSLAGGILETLGLDGSVFSNPFEWPTVKSAMAGVNFLGSLFSGGGEGSGGPGGAASASGQGGLGGLLSGLVGATGISDAITTSLNPGGSNIAAPHIGSNAAPGPGNDGTGGNADPYNGPQVVIQNAGMSPTDVSNKLNAVFNARTRTTKVH